MPATPARARVGGRAGSPCDLLPAGRLGAGLRQLPAQFVKHLIGGTNAARLHVLKPACNRLVQYPAQQPVAPLARSEEHTSELQSLMRISYAVCCLNKKNNYTT